MKHEHQNALIHQSSPYLLQHAHNPVDWEPWDQKVLDRALQENKPLVISIGYASCHWCHVMERECFEDLEVAQLMNLRFVNIKVDREERPDVDQIYMDALQMISGQGGWPLNVVALPDGRPIWGATYLPKDRWMSALAQVADLIQNDRERVESYAHDLAQGLQEINLVTPQGEDVPSLEALDRAVRGWSRHFDLQMGGHKGAPKFMMPNQWEFLMHYATARKDAEIQEFVELTLEKMAFGGIYDHVGGGFSRYSVDAHWHVPHFEKMAYDNGQLISLYAKAYARTKNPLYQKVVRQCIAFVKEELLAPSGGFYSSLDADSTDSQGNLVEGAHYVWTKAELTRLLGKEFPRFRQYYNINDFGHWEAGKYVPIRSQREADIAKGLGIPLEELQRSMARCLEILKGHRDRRPKPRLDDKILCSWNALLLKGLLDAHRYLGSPEYLDLALDNAHFLEREMLREDHALFRNHKGGKSSINGFLEDHACLIEAFLALYEVTFEEKWLELGKGLLDHCIQHYRDPDSGLFYFTSDRDAALIRRSMETMDNVISSSNAILATNLFKYGRLFPEASYGPMALRMLQAVQGDLLRRPQGHARWLHLILYHQLDFFEVALVGDDIRGMAGEISREYLPNSLLAGGGKDSRIPLVGGRYVEGASLAHVCRQGACKLPVATAAEVLKELRA